MKREVLSYVQKASQFRSLFAFGITLLATGVLASLSLITWTWAIVSLMAVATVILAAVELYLRLKRLLVQISGESRNNVVDLNTSITSAIFLSSQFPHVVMPLSGYSMGANNLSVVNDILNTRKPTVIVELGSGISTILVAQWLKSQGRGRITSFDHQRLWAEKCSFYLAQNGLERFAEVRTAPLADAGLVAEPRYWYQLDDQIDDLNDIELLIVDGPPAGEANPFGRLPALYKFHERLSKNATVFIDDGSRIGERRVVEKWIHEFPDLSGHLIGTLTGCWILERSAEDLSSV